MDEFTELAAQQAELIHSIDTVWVALCAALIFSNGRRICITRSRLHTKQKCNEYYFQSNY